MTQKSTRFDNVYVSPRVRVALHSVLDTQQAKKFWDLVNKLRTGLFNTPGMRVERLHTKTGKVYSARLNIEMRIIFSMYTESKTSQRSLVVWDANHHDDAYDRIERTVIPAVFQPASNFLEPDKIWTDEENLAELHNEVPDPDEVTNGILLFRVPYYVLSQPDRYQSFEQNIDRYLRLSEEQEELLQSTDRAHLVRGSAGTGKTSLALFYALNLFEQHPEDNIYFFTYQEELACVCRCYKSNLLEENGNPADSGDFRVFSYIEFCRHYFKQNLHGGSISWQWIDRTQSIQHLKEIISTRARWSRSISSENLYSYIYSILKGRFVPGTDKIPQSNDDFQRIFKGYGNVPRNIDDLLEIYAHYEERLGRYKQKDEADLIRYCYHSLKDKAALSDSERRVWILIDEMQDFTELEWKSILLFWENQCTRNPGCPTFPFLCGDRNQNISRSGFRWQEVESYVGTVLRDIHRLNAIERVQLHRNFRNTREIYNFATYIRSQGPALASDLGLPPELNGNKPKIVVGDYSQFIQFLTLLNDPYDEKLPAPMVVLFEDSQALGHAQRNVTNDEQLFFMPVERSKGLEFEDLIVYRLFASLHSLQSNELNSEEASRLFDLWYMTITRARQNLLVYMSADDMECLKQTLGDRFNEFLRHVELHTTNTQTELLRFYHQRERYLPNYAIIFLERTKANQTWQDFRNEIENGRGQEDYAVQLKRKSIKLWKRCRDIVSLGRAYAEVGEYEEAIPYLTQANLPAEAAKCLEDLNRFEAAAQNYEQAGQILDAARCYEAARKYHAAARMYEQKQEWLRSATNYYLGGDNLKAAKAFERAQMWQSAADLYRSKSQWLKAAQLYQECEAFEQAGDMFLKVKDKLDAARCYKRGQQFSKAAALYEALMRWAESAECYEQAGMYGKAGSLFLKAGRLKDAARCKEISGDLVSAAAAYERMQDWGKAAHAYIRLKQPEKAAECFENEDNWEQACLNWEKSGNKAGVARCLKRAGKLAEAAKHYSEIDENLESALCYENAQLFEAAAAQYLKANNLSGAASMLARSGRRLDAAKLYLKAGQTIAAIEICSKKISKTGSVEKDLTHQLMVWLEESKKWDLAGLLYESLGMMPRAIEKYKQAVMLDKAAECAEKAKLFETAADLFLQAGKIEQAATCFIESDQLYQAGRCYELLQRWDKALVIYQKLNDLEGIKRCESASNWL